MSSIGNIMKASGLWVLSYLLPVKRLVVLKWRELVHPHYVQLRFCGKTGPLLSSGDFKRASVDVKQKM